MTMNDVVSSYFKLVPIVDLQSQTRILPDGSRVAAFLENDELKQYLFDDVRTICEAVQRGLRVSNNGPMLGQRKQQSNGTTPFVWMTYKEVIDRSFDLTAGLSELGVKPGQETFIAIYAKNRPEWIISELATYNNRNIVVSLYDTLGTDARSFIINQASIEIVICDEEKKAYGLVEEKSRNPSLKHLILLDSFGDDLKEKAAKEGISVHRFDDVLTMGRQIDKSHFEPPKPEDLCTLCYTSGTTGIPKGVMLTHGNVIATTTIFQNCSDIDMGPSDVMLSYLPLAHMYERMMECHMYTMGVKVGFFSGNIRKIIEDMKELKPTIVPLVPRMLTRIYEKASTIINSSYLKKMIFNLSIAYKSYKLRRGIVCNDSLIDSLVFKRLQEEMGGRVRFMTIGSAPISGDVLNFARATLGAVIVEGYGQTECVAACAVCIPADMSTDQVGIPSPCNAIKLIDVPELGYFTKDGVGEICIRGYNVFKGYYKDDEKTKEVLDSDGWLHSGDIGRWTEKGTLKIIDRKKHIFKLQQGEYIAPEKIETIYGQSKYVRNVFVYGESLKTCIIAIIVPEEEVLRSTISEQQLQLNDVTFEELCANETIKKLIFNDIIEIGKKGGLNSMELVKDIYLSPEIFTIDNGLMTPTMKYT
uniref:Long-chain-fatty-acid--CoA ligase n=1 Tax=Ascaris suum TaxID=6253 RepID=F1KZW9_ASCSU